MSKPEDQGDPVKAAEFSQAWCRASVEWMVTAIVSFATGQVMTYQQQSRRLDR